MLMLISLFFEVQQLANTTLLLDILTQIIQTRNSGICNFFVMLLSMSEVKQFPYNYTQKNKWHQNDSLGAPFDRPSNSRLANLKKEA